jgi:SNF2-related domain
VGINWAAALNRLEEVDRVLVITVTSGLGVWQGQIEDHCPLAYAIYSHHGELLSRTQAKPEIIFLLVNYENLYTRAYTQGREWVPVSNRLLYRFLNGARRPAVIADEVHHLGNPSAEQSKHACALARLCGNRRLGMTGTMFHRRPFFVFGIMKFYDDGKTFGTAWSHFKERVAIFRDPAKHVVARYRNLRWMMDSVRPVAYIEKKIPKRPLVRNLLHFDLEGKNLDYYADMEVHRVLKIQGETLTADIVLTKHLWLMMITGGFIRLPSGKYVQIGTSKLKIAKDRLNEYMFQDNHKIVVACRFKPELPAVAKIAKQVGFQPILFHGGIPKGEERHRRTRFFQQAKKPVAFIAQIATGAESIQLDAADTILWYNLTEDYVKFDQFKSRIEQYNDKRTLMHDFLIARGTRDEVTLEAMQLKQDVARYLQTHPERAEELVARHSG